MTQTHHPKHVSVPTNRERATWGHGDGALVDCLVDSDGTVRAYDEIAGHYTLHHSLPAEVVAEARRLAEVSAAEGGAA